MSEFPEGAFRAAGGRLGQLIYENPAAGVEAELQFFLEVAVEPFEFEGETHSPLFRVDNIVVPIRSWRGLEHASYDFPWAPKPGSVDATLMMFGERNPADVTRIECGSIEGGTIRAFFDTEIDFEMEADRDDLERVETSFDLRFTVEPLRVSTSLEKRVQGEEDRIREEVDALVDLGDYGVLEKAPGGYQFAI